MTALRSGRSFLPVPPGRHIPTYYVRGLRKYRAETRVARCSKIGVKIKKTDSRGVMGQNDESADV